MENRKMSGILLTAGQIIGDRYRIVGLLGKGGMGVVYAAQDMKLGNMIRAIKISSQQKGSSGSFTREASLLMKLNHPHLPQIVDFLTLDEGGTGALVTDYFQGKTIAACYEHDSTTFSFTQVIHIAKQLCSALRYLHEQDPPIIHRDIKPSNVMLNRKGLVKLIDFGISRLGSDSTGMDTERLGTVGFAAPEQVIDGPLDARTDIFGLGALLYFIVTHGAPYQHKESMFGGRLSFHLMKASIPRAFEDMLKKMLQASPSERYQSIVEVELELNELEQLTSSIAGFESAGRTDVWHTTTSRMISLISISPGAGASFVAVILANLLAKQDLCVTAAEYGQIRPEWHHIFSRNKELTLAESIVDSRYIRFRQQESGIDWLALHPESGQQEGNSEEAVDQMLRHSKSDLQLIDLSNRWQNAEAAKLLNESRVVIAVGDPAVYKWQAAELRSLQCLEAELSQSGRAFLWLANKDTAFHGRKEWLTLFPSPPIGIIPQLPHHAIWQAMWEGRFITDDIHVCGILQRAFQPIIRLLKRELITSGT